MACGQIRARVLWDVFPRDCCNWATESRIESDSIIRRFPNCRVGGISMKRILLGAVALVAISAVPPALGADLTAAPVYTKAPPPVVAYSWTGFYVGGSAGYGWSNSATGLVGTPVFATPFIVGGPQSLAASVAAIPPVLNTHPAGFIGGGQIGYNYQTGRTVWGIETDFSGANISGSATQMGSAALTGFPGSFASATAVGSQRLDYLGTVRGRAGFTPLDPLLLYVTGGFAYGHLTTSTSVSEAFSFPTPFPAPAVGSAASMRTGWTVGAGAEWGIAPNWSIKAEYLYFDLGGASYSLTPLTSIGGGLPYTTAAVTAANSDFKGNIVRVGVNYKFSGPVVARY